MGMHECQSRFFENIVGRSHAFWKPIYGKVAQMFGSPLTETSLEDFLAAVNRTVPGLIRTEAVSFLIRCMCWCAMKLRKC